MYKAKCNIYCDGKNWVMGEVYKESEIKGLPLSDFEFVGEKKVKKVEKKDK